MPFSKLDSEITKSSLWSEDLHVRIVFVSFLAEKDENGFVSGSRSGLIRICNVTPEQFDHAIMKLSSPDPDSKSKDFEGRRIDIVEGGWIVLNSDKYRAPEQDKKQKRNEYMKEYMRNRRNLASVNSNIKLTPVNDGLTSVSVSVSDSVSDSVLFSNKQTSINTSSSGDADELFNTFWNEYPKKQGKGSAIKAWKKIKHQSETLEKITTALSWQKNSPDWKKDKGQYVPMPATYLNGMRWEDEPTKNNDDEKSGEDRRRVFLL